MKTEDSIREVSRGGFLGETPFDISSSQISAQNLACTHEPIPKSDLPNALDRSGAAFYASRDSECSVTAVFVHIGTARFWFQKAQRAFTRTHGRL